MANMRICKHKQLPLVMLHSASDGSALRRAKTESMERHGAVAASSNVFGEHVNLVRLYSVFNADHECNVAADQL